MQLISHNAAGASDVEHVQAIQRAAAAEVLDDRGNLGRLRPAALLVQHEDLAIGIGELPFPNPRHLATLSLVISDRWSARSERDPG